MDYSTTSFIETEKNTKFRSSMRYQMTSTTNKPYKNIAITLYRSKEPILYAIFRSLQKHSNYTITDTSSHPI